VRRRNSARPPVVVGWDRAGVTNFGRWLRSPLAVHHLPLVVTPAWKTQGRGQPQRPREEITFSDVVAMSRLFEQLIKLVSNLLRGIRNSRRLAKRKRFPQPPCFLLADTQLVGAPRQSKSDQPQIEARMALSKVIGEDARVRMDCFFLRHVVVPFESIPAKNY